jgi:RND family efflux transporter MFP subunit
MPASRLSSMLILGILLSGCRSKQEAPQAAAPPPPEVAVSQVLDRKVIDYGEFTGRTDASGDVQVQPRVSGYIQKVYFKDGQDVNVGDVLFQIDPRPFEATLKSAEAQKAQWQARLNRAKADLARYQKLAPTGAASAQDVDKAAADLGEAEAGIQASEASIDRAKLDLEFARITAPVSGQTSKAYIKEGNLVQGGGGKEFLLTTIMPMQPINVDFDVDERSLLLFRQRARAATAPGASQPTVEEVRLPVYVGLATEEGYPHQGVIDFSDNQVNASTGTIRLRGKFDNKKRIFKPGLFVRVRVPISEPYAAILVSDRAIGTDQGQKFVYVVNDKNIVEYRPVKLGRLQDDGLRAITEGLKPGEWVIVTGLQRARPDKPVTPRRVEMPQRQISPTTRPDLAAPASVDASKTRGQH